MSHPKAGQSLIADDNAVPPVELRRPFWSRIRKPTGPVAKRRYPAAPAGWVFYVIGDVHGRLDCLTRAHGKIDEDHRRRGHDKVAEIYLGDLINRGPQSSGVIEALIARQLSKQLRLVRGNHEIMLEAFLAGQLTLEQWRAAGGSETLLSYPISRDSIRLGGAALLEEARHAIPAHHLAFLASAEPYLHIGDYCFVHAGLRPGVALDQQNLEDLAWIRGDFLDSRFDFGYTVVHGHTPVTAIDFQPNRINIDTGAFLTNNLTVLVIDDTGAFELNNGV